MKIILKQGNKRPIKMVKPSSELIKRSIFTIVLILTAGFIIYSGPIVIMLSLIFVQVNCFREIINIGYTVNKLSHLPKLPNFRLILWYLLCAANFFLYGETLATHLEVFVRKRYLLHRVVSHHRFISFCLYLFGIVWFVKSVVKKYGLRQYKILAWTHILLMIIVLQIYMMIQNMFAGLMWLTLPIFLVVVNDIFAYIFGRLFGTRPLIEVSPKKTWEGFIGGAISTVIFGVLASSVMCHYKYFKCPVEYVETEDGISMSSNCKYLSYVFHLKEYSLKEFLFIDYKIYVYPFVFHSLALSLFASIIAPFGGYFASGFKRALKMKDFSDTIPGHGGLMDRFDCQFLMATFVNVYIFTFFKTYKIEKIFQRISNLDSASQVEFYNMLERSLKVRNII